MKLNKGVETSDNEELRIELEKTKLLLDITRNKLFTAISTITELELIISLDREKIKSLTDSLGSLDLDKTE